MSFFRAFIAPLFLLLAASNAQAEVMEVGWPSSHEVRRLKMESDDFGDITVYLTSSGDMLDNFKILLVDDKKKKLLRVKKSNIHGISTFRGVRPGVYTVLVKLNKKQRRRNSVKVGDVKLVLSDKLDSVGGSDEPNLSLEGEEKKETEGSVADE